MLSTFSSIKTLRYSPNEVMETHAHDYTSLSLVLAGGYEETIRGASREFGTGALLVCPPGEPHSQLFGRKGLFKLVLVPAAETADRLNDLAPLARAPAFQSIEVANVGHRLLRELEHRDAFSELVIDGLSHELTGLFGRGHCQDAGPWPSYLRTAIAFLHENDAAAPNLNAVAAAADCDADTLSGAFRRYLGCTAGEYQRRLRIERATQMLAEGKTPISEVALTCGFSDQPHLNRAFKAHMGMTPAAYRRLRS